MMFDAIKLFMGGIWGYIKPLVVSFLGATGKIVLDIAMGTVKDLANADLTSSEKREVAFDRIEKDLKQKGVEAKASLINAAIEIAVQNLKKLQ